MADPGAALHKALFAALSGGLSRTVYDAVPEHSAYPYITIDASIADDARFLSDRLDQRFVYLNVWSEVKGQQQVLEIMGEIDDLLDGQKLTLDTGTVVGLTVQRKTTQRDADTVTYMGTVTLNIWTQH